MAEVVWTIDKLKNTLDYLKVAVKNEREERKTIKSKLEEISDVAIQTEKSLKEKIHQISILNLVIQDLDHKIKKLQTIESYSENHDKIADSRSLFILEQQNSKLKEDNQSLSTQNENLDSRIQVLEKEINENTTSLASSDDILKLKVENLKTQINRIRLHLDQNKQEKFATITEIEKLKEKSSELDSKIREKNVDILLLEEKHSKVKKEVDSIKEYEKEIVDKLANHIKIEHEMAEELLKYRSTVAEARSSYQKFQVKRIWLLTTTNVTLVLRKGEDGKHILQTIDGKKVNSYKVSEVDAVFMHPSKPNRFFLRTNGEQDQEYESENSVKIMGLIRELVFSDFNIRD